MSFTEADYQSAAKRLRAPVAYVKAIAEVESAGETFWVIDGQELVPVRYARMLASSFAFLRKRIGSAS